MTLTNIYSYTLKSGKAANMGSAEIVATGIRNDRTFVVINKKNRVVTGRDFPELTTISATVEGATLELSKSGRERLIVALPDSNEKKISFKLFRNSVEGLPCSNLASDWLSAVLGFDCNLAYIDTNFRQIDPKRGGNGKDFFAYADASPIHIVTKESLQHLNSLLETKVSALHFRPNFVVQGAKAFAEDLWKTVVINDCKFEVHHKCERCIFTTIDPETGIKDEAIEPLSTLARFRRERNEPLTFGVYLVPRKTGTVQIGDSVRPIVT